MDLILGRKNKLGTLHGFVYVWCFKHLQKYFLWGLQHFSLFFRSVAHDVQLSNNF